MLRCCQQLLTSMGGYECIYIMAAIRDSCNSIAVTSSFFHTDFLQEESVTNIITVLAAKNSKSYNNRQMCHCPEGYEILLTQGKETSIHQCLDGIGYKV